MKKLNELNLKYKNYLEKWYEEDFRRNKDSLVKKVKKIVREENKEKLEFKIFFFLLMMYIIILLGIIFIEKISSFLMKPIDLKFNEKLTIVSILIPSIAFVHNKFSNLILRLIYIYYNIKHFFFS